jgi:branched-chain amino acid transport system permease protein
LGVAAVIGLVTVIVVIRLMPQGLGNLFMRLRREET